MRSAWIRRVVASVLGAAALGGAPAWANGHFGRSVGLAPTEFIAVAPTAYYVPTSYILPTSYVATSYVETRYTLSPTTAYFVPTVYTPTAYVVPTTTVVPTSYVVPTGFSDYEVVTTAFDCLVPCATPCATAAPVMESPRVSEPSARKPQKDSTATPAEKPPATLDSIPTNEPAGVSGGAEGAEPTTKTKAAGAGASPTTPLDSSVPSPPVAPVPDKEPAAPTTSTPVQPPIEPAPADKPAGTNVKPAPAAGGNPAPATPGSAPVVPKPPVAPGSDPDAGGLPPPVGLDSTVRRDAQRPVFSTSTRGIKAFQHPMKNGNLTALQGRIVASGSNAFEEGVQVTLSNRLQTFADRVVTSDALGRYAVWLPDGDWTVKVTMPSGRTYAVSQLTVIRGQITDDQGRDIPSLTITR